MGSNARFHPENKWPPPCNYMLAGSSGMHVQVSKIRTSTYVETHLTPGAVYVRIACLAWAIIAKADQGTSTMVLTAVILKKGLSVQ